MRREEIPFDAATLIRKIGRGAAGSRSLERHEARTLFDAMLGNRLSESVIGAVIIALRVKGESCDELLGALDALPPFVKPIETYSDRPVVSIPSYNGARNLPNLTWLLALLVARQGVQVIVHGKSNVDLRTHTEDIVRAWDAATLETTDDTRTNTFTTEHQRSSFLQDTNQSLHYFQRRQPVFVPLDTLSPALSKMIDRRLELGVRNTAHSLVKLMNPTVRKDCLRLTCFTHPEFEVLQHEVFTALAQPAMIVRATEGEVVANVRKSARIDLMNRGFTVPVVEPDNKGFAALNLPTRSDLTGTINYMQEILSGAISMPSALAMQVDAIVNAARLPQ
jgi:anthranilate phosphoribosyltransferase